MSRYYGPTALIAGRLTLTLTVAVTLALMMAVAAPGGTAAAADPGEVARPARLATVQAADGIQEHAFPARTEAVQVVDLSFRVPGLLQELPVEEGTVVSAGTLIARLDPTDYERKVRQAEVNLTSARQDFERKQELVSQNAVSRKAFDDARNALDLAEVALDEARQNLAYTELTAPFDAVVSRRLLESFTNVQAGQPVVRVQDVSEIRVAADIPEHLMARHRNDDDVEVSVVFPFLRDRTFALEFRELSTEANDVAQTYEVAFGMPRPDDISILPGMTATIYARAKARDVPDGAVIVPPGALVPALPGGEQAGDDQAGQASGSFFVWVVEGIGDQPAAPVRRQPVTVARMANGEALVVEGLTAGQVVVTAGVHHLRDGMRVRPLSSE